jgi:hypothetical protein
MSLPEQSLSTGVHRKNVDVFGRDAERNEDYLGNRILQCYMVLNAYMKTLGQSRFPLLYSEEERLHE